MLFRSMRSLEESVQTYNIKKNPFYSAFLPKDIAEEFGSTPSITGGGSTFEILDVKAIKQMPDPQWLVKGLVVDLGMGFIFGPPGCGKSFIALDLAFCIASGRADWWGRPVQHHGPAIYISSEGVSDIKHRIAAWEADRKSTRLNSSH